MTKGKTVGVIEARMGSTRLPSKMMMPLAGVPIIDHVVHRAQACIGIEEVVLATTVEPQDATLEERAAQLGIACYRGSEDDVLSRVLGAACAIGGEVIVKISGDNPFYHPDYIDPIIAYYQNSDFDFVTNTTMGFSSAWKEERTWPIGTGINVFSTALLAESRQDELTDADREHVIKHFVEGPDRYRLGGFHAEGSFSHYRRPELRFCLDTEQDLQFLRAIFDKLYPTNPLFGLDDVIKLIDQEPTLLEIIDGIQQKTI